MPIDVDRTPATNRFLDLLEAGDRRGIGEMLDPDVVWSAPMSATGDANDVEAAQGIEAFASRLASIGRLNREARFTERRVTPSSDGATTFVQTRGDFLTADGRPYRNVYVFRFDWKGDRILSWEEYANPITILRTFRAEYGELLHQLVSGS